MTQYIEMTLGICTLDPEVVIEGVTAMVRAYLLALAAVISIAPLASAFAGVSGP